MFKLGDSLIINDEMYKVFQIGFKDYRLLSVTNYNRFTELNLYGVEIEGFINDLQRECEELDLPLLRVVMMSEGDN